MQGCKKVVSIQDISGLGRCSLTVVIPVLSAMGIQVCPVPTAVLSAHTGYSEFVMRDLTDFMKPALEHYKKMDMKFDCVYSGFLASSEQIDHKRSAPTEEQQGTNYQNEVFIFCTSVEKRNNGHCHTRYYPAAYFYLPYFCRHRYSENKNKITKHKHHFAV